jgi:hypothetical protein
MIDVYYLNSLIKDDITKLESAKNLNFIEVIGIVENNIYNIEVPDGN